MEDRSLHIHVCLNEFLHSFKHFVAYRTIDLLHGAGEELLSKVVTYHDQFFKKQTRKVYGDSCCQRVSTSQVLYIISISFLDIMKKSEPRI